MLTPAVLAVAREPWVRWDWVSRHTGTIVHALNEHLVLTGLAVVTTIGLVTVTALIGQGGLGQLILDGLQRDFRTEVVVGSVLSVAVAGVADISLVTVQSLATPWTRAPRN